MQIETDVSIWNNLVTIAEYEPNNRAVLRLVFSDISTPSKEDTTELEVLAIEQVLYDVFVAHLIGNRDENLYIATDAITQIKKPCIMKFAKYYKYEDYRLYEYIHGDHSKIKFYHLDVRHADALTTLVHINEGEFEQSLKLTPIDIHKTDNSWQGHFEDSNITHIAPDSIFDTVYNGKYKYYQCSCSLVKRIPCRHVLALARNVNIWWWSIIEQFISNKKNIPFVPLRKFSHVPLDNFLTIVADIK